MSDETRGVIGLMSGTSMDAVDVAFLRTDGESRIEPGPAASFAYQPAERVAIAEALGRTDPPQDAVTAVTDAHIRAIAAFFQTHPMTASQTTLIGFHGQTIHHDPANRVTVQIGDAERIAEHFDIPVAHDFRSADVAAGGEGAPLAPLYHQALSAPHDKPMCVLNLGGVGNVTWLGPDEAILAFDTGPANAPIDDLVRGRTGDSFDRDGAIAASGRVDSARLRNWLELTYFPRTPPKSLDRNDFEMDVSDLSLVDAAATLSAFSVAAVRAAEAHFPIAPLGWLVTGGGRHNAHLMRLLDEQLTGEVLPVEAAGWAGDALEAQCFAWLAVRVQRGLPLSLPTTTGVPVPMPGGRIVYPAAAAAISARRRST